VSVKLKYLAGRESLPKTSSDQVNQMREIIKLFMTAENPSSNTQEPPSLLTNNCTAWATGYLKGNSLDLDAVIWNSGNMECQFVKNSIQKNAHHSLGPNASSKAKIDGLPKDTFGTDFGRELRQFSAELGALHSGGYRQLRHLGMPLASKLDLRVEGWDLLNGKKANVSDTLFSACLCLEGQACSQLATS
jgi:hypothetical protein